MDTEGKRRTMTVDQIEEKDHVSNSQERTHRLERQHVDINHNVTAALVVPAVQTNCRR